MSGYKFNFNELTESIKEATNIKKGIKKNPSRSFKFENISDDKSLESAVSGNSSDLKNRALVKVDSDDINREKVSEWKPDGDSDLE